MASHSDRIGRNTSGEVPPPVRLDLAFAALSSPEEVLARTRDVMLLVADAAEGTWPSDEEWRRRLPEWFLRTFDGHDAEQLMKDPNLWDFGSWLDAMRDRGWEWWSSTNTDSGGIVRCSAHADPYAIEPLVYLLHAAGASEVRFEEEQPTR